MFPSTLFAVAISAFAAMTLAAPSNVKRHNDDLDNVINVNDLGLVNVDELAKGADVLNDVNILSSERHDDHFHGHHGHHDHHDYHDYHGHHGYYDFDDEST